MLQVLESNYTPFLFQIQIRCLNYSVIAQLSYFTRQPKHHLRRFEYYCVFSIYLQKYRNCTPKHDKKQWKRHLTKSRSENSLVGAILLPVLTGIDMLPALLLHYCRIIKHATAPDETEAQRESKAAHSYQLSHNSHLIGNSKKQKSPFLPAQHKSKYEKLL